MRRVCIGVIAVLTLAGTIALAGPSQALPDGPGVPAPCGGPVPCGSADEKVGSVVNRVRGLCPGSVCPRP